MTREEEILSQAKLITGLFSFRNGLQTPEDAYVSGANWADANPVNPWHKASEELPEVPEKKKYVKVLTTLPHGSGYDFRILYFHKGFGFSKYKEYQNVYYKDKKTGCVHWMHIPEIKEER